MAEERNPRKRKWRWMLFVCVLMVGALYFSRSDGNRLVMERTFNRRGCLIGTSPDGRIAMVADGILMLIGTNHAETTVATLDAEGIQGIPVGTNGFILVDAAFGSGSSMRMYDWAGQKLWTSSVRSRSLQIGVSQEGTIYALDETNVLYALNLDGTIRWTNSSFSSRRILGEIPAVDPVGRVAMMEIDMGLRVLDRNGHKLWGNALWPANPAGSHASFAGNGDLVVASGAKLRRYDQTGTLLWDRDFSWMTALKRPLSGIDQAPVIGPDGTIYCLANDRILAVDSEGGRSWQRSVASYTPNTWKQNFGRDWATFNRAGELVTVAADYELLQSSAKPGPGMRLVTLAANERLICLGKDGSVRWEQPMPSSISWKLPMSRWDWKILWESRMGLHKLKYFRTMTTAADGTIYGLGMDNSRTRIWVIRGD